VVPIAYGLPDTRLEAAAAAGEVALGGCVIGDADPAWACAACGHRFGDRQGPPTPRARSPRRPAGGTGRARRAPAAVIVSEQGGRRTLEDRHVITAVAGGIFAAVYDGHGGSRTADLVAARLHQAFAQACRRGAAPDAAFRHAFAALDRATTRHASGTTATCVFLTQDRLTVAHVGDSTAVLVGAGSPRPLTRDHRVNHPAERQRILKAGGRVEGAYVVRGDHGLMVTRSLGDRVFRPAGVIAEPEVTHVRLSPRDRLVVVATDGLWDVLSPREVATLLTAGPWDIPTVSERLRDAVTARDPRDNVTAVVLRRPPP
jgi:serine/threonine protein phosphatase PrpC